MGRLWKLVNGEPYMVNDPRLGILGLNPKKKGKAMAKRGRWGASHMKWVRSFQKRRRKANYVMAGPVVGVNPRHRRRRHHTAKRNPGRARRYATAARGFLGLPPLMPIVYGAAGFVGVAGLQGVVTGFLPTDWVTDPTTHVENKMTKYGVLAVSLIGLTWIAKSVLGPGPAALAGVGGGVYIVSQVAHDFMPGVIPGMGDDGTSIGAYAQIRGVHAYRQMRQPAQIGAPDFGFMNTANTAPGGAATIVQERFKRF